ncbi:MAG: hypothetical protein G01um101418_22 [Parcubacteria group bacterium Gr01-1014_18]|nr:MAG: hypothetical protein Greene041636_22 [Parcubacteria group bacterium Greene0416_36]TSC81528.1 MAG: hypothetical protein G01um101418_22 [Parcubacteria group bacterium Gr01-1014_18]TSC99661.1 MAG: hypothetical protein Greene101420_65 [Parcubacteria group bacterium Greene1014_20]TSD07112.1 MAG: hypothetical protein Greene07142_424 [Parcubacteria group bacterium Greene0714_2]
MHSKIEIFGWYGTVAIISAYFANSFGYLDAGSLIYQLLNLTGALGIVAISLSKKVYQPMVINIIWAIIAVFALIKILF